MLKSTQHDEVVLIELDHGGVNALDLELLEALIDVFRGTPVDAPIVLTGSGGAFSAGVDLRRIVDGGPEYIAPFLDALSACILAVYDHPGPVVAAVNGAAIAGGCVMAAACDRRLISHGPIGLAERAVGVVFPTAALEIMRGLVGPRAAELVLSARLLDADAAVEIGLADEVVAPDRLLDSALEQAARLHALPAGVFAHTKRQLQGPTRERITARAPSDDAAMHQLWASSGGRAAVEGYMSRLARPRG